MTAGSQSPRFVVIFQERYTHHVGITREGETSSNFPKDEDSTKSKELWGQIKSEAEHRGGQLESKSESHRPYLPAQHYDGGIDTVHYLINMFEFASAAGVGAFLKSAADIFFKWEKLHDGRSIKVKIGSDEIAVNNPDDLEKAVRVYQQLSGK